MRLALEAARTWPASRGRLLTVTLVVAAAVWLPALLAAGLADELLAWDVRYAYLPAAEAVLDSGSPYPALDDPILEEQKGYVYPPQLALVLVPLTPLPIEPVALLVAVSLVALIVLLLLLLGVRDVRCHAAALLWMPVASGVLLANVSIPLAFALALAWRYRNRVFPAAAALGLAVSAKLLLWPVLVWTIATRRARTVAWAVAVGLGVTLGAWAAIGFAGLSSYPSLLRRLSEIQAENSYSLVGMAATLGLGEGSGRALTLAVGGGLLFACALLARRGDELRAFTCAVAAALALSPIVWLHYLVLLLVPLAIARPRFSAVWLLPIVLWASPRPGYAEGLQTFLPAIAATILLAVVLARPRPGGSTRADAAA
jgi:hypothetical protein